MTSSWKDWLTLLRGQRRYHQQEQELTPPTTTSQQQQRSNLIVIGDLNQIGEFHLNRKDQPLPQQSQIEESTPQPLPLTTTPPHHNWSRRKISYFGLIRAPIVKGFKALRAWIVSIVWMIWSKLVFIKSNETTVSSKPSDTTAATAESESQHHRHHHSHDHHQHQHHKKRLPSYLKCLSSILILADLVPAFHLGYRSSIVRMTGLYLLHHHVGYFFLTQILFWCPVGVIIAAIILPYFLQHNLGFELILYGIAIILFGLWYYAQWLVNNSFREACENEGREFFKNMLLEAKNTETPDENAIVEHYIQHLHRQKLFNQWYFHLDTLVLGSVWRLLPHRRFMSELHRLLLTCLILGTIMLWTMVDIYRNTDCYNTPFSVDEYKYPCTNPASSTLPNVHRTHEDRPWTWPTYLWIGIGLELGFLASILTSGFVSLIQVAKHPSIIMKKVAFQLLHHRHS